MRDIDGVADVIDASTPDAPHPTTLRARALIPALRDRIATTRELRRLPDETVRDAHDAGLFGLLLPKELGGDEGGPREFVDVVRALAQGDPSAAWTLSFFIAHNWVLARWTAEAQDRVFEADRLPLMAAATFPPGRAERVPGGYRLNGRWGYCSGVMNADWVQLVGAVDEHQPARLFLVPRAEVEVPDTWHMAGLKGTGSHDVVADNLFVPEARTLPDITFLATRHPGTERYSNLSDYDGRDILTLLMPSLILGAAEGMMRDYRSRLETKRAAYSSELAGDTEAGRLRYARALSRLRAAEAMLHHVVLQITTATANGTQPLGEELRAAIKLDCLTVGRLARESIDAVVRGSGASIFRAGDPAQHILQDVEIMLNHLTIDEDGMTARAAEVLLDRPLPPNTARVFT
ncbi:acyl-CoA dehydrogenase family protein [Streptomyces sp. NPDC048445]|uniref:acyl-CoA dehydrogenase family protein n=1 Tax=Streptomyces sp. NPDC048445 TaxID=3365553 RepID=UPI0037114157